MVVDTCVECGELFEYSELNQYVMVCNECLPKKIGNGSLTKKAGKDKVDASMDEYPNKVDDSVDEYPNSERNFCIFIAILGLFGGINFLVNGDSFGNFVLLIVSGFLLFIRKTYF